MKLILLFYFSESPAESNLKWSENLPNLFPKSDDCFFLLLFVFCFFVCFFFFHFFYDFKNAEFINVMHLEDTH